MTRRSSMDISFQNSRLVVREIKDGIVSIGLARVPGSKLYLPA